MKTDRAFIAPRGFESLFLRHYFFDNHIERILLINIAGWSSLVARWAHNPKVVGSNPSPATKWSRGVAVNMPDCHSGDREFDSRRDRHLGSVAQSVEQWIENPCVGGSIPSRATINILTKPFIRFFYLRFFVKIKCSPCLLKRPLLLYYLKYNLCKYSLSRCKYLLVVVIFLCPNNSNRTGRSLFFF